ncbi:MAG: hypothetical protein JW940_13265, partial [Polyangiaceae bacterium]|nr:hypothetical protein [Polyangiaceae bacterium]
TFGSGGAFRGSSGSGAGGRLVANTGGASAAGATGTAGNNCLDCHTREYLDENVPGWENAPPR